MWNLACSIADKASAASGQKFCLPSYDMLKLPCVIACSFKNDDLICDHRLAADSVHTDGHIMDSVILCRGTLVAGSHLGRSIVFSNGDIKIGSHITDCIIFCDGDVEVASHVANSIILARGTVRMGRFTRNSLIQQQDNQPLQLLKLFDATLLGIKTTIGPEGIHVEEVAEGKLFAYLFSASKRLYRYTAQVEWMKFLEN
jgi:ADP-glucose pyrophosphorylase